MHSVPGPEEGWHQVLGHSLAGYSLHSFEPGVQDLSPLSRSPEITCAYRDMAEASGLRVEPWALPEGAQSFQNQTRRSGCWSCPRAEKTQ